MSNDDLIVFGAGFGRTGTMSLKVALDTLGVGPCHHMHEGNCRLFSTCPLEIGQEQMYFSDSTSSVG